MRALPLPPRAHANLGRVVDSEGTQAFWKLKPLPHDAPLLPAHWSSIIECKTRSSEKLVLSQQKPIWRCAPKHDPHTLYILREPESRTPANATKAAALLSHKTIALLQEHHWLWPRSQHTKSFQPHENKHTFGVESSYGCSDMSAQVTLNTGVPWGPVVISEWYRHLELGFVAEACLRDVRKPTG